MAQATVAVDRLEALQIGSQITTKITFEQPLVFGHDLEDLIELFFIQF